MTGYTVVTREPEWDDFQRDRLLALAVYESGIHDCGWHKDLIDDPSMEFDTEREHCEICEMAARANRIYSANDEPKIARLKAQHGEKLPPEVALPSDGRKTVLRVKAPTSGAPGPDA